MLAVALLTLRPAHAASTVVPPGRGRAALAVDVSAAGVRAAVCPSATGCAATGAPLEVPADVSARLAQGKARPIALAGGGHVVLVEVPGEGDSSWIMLISAPSPGNGGEPHVVLRGWLGKPRGEHGEARSTVLLEEGTATAKRLIVGERREDVTMCGRPTVVRARELDPDTMDLVPGRSLQSLTEDERSHAERIVAARVPTEVSAPTPPLLRARAASSAAGNQVAGLTDGRLETAWSEDSRGEGKGDFVALSSSKDVPIRALRLAVRPSTETPNGVGPRTFFLATADQVFHVTMPEDGYRQPDARYEITLPSELRTDCISIVLDSAYVPAGERNPRVTLAEVTAITEFSEASAEALVGALAGGGARARAAAAMLVRGGLEATKATIAGYPKLDAEGQALARDVIEAGPCSEEVPFYASELARAVEARSERDGERARDRLRRCGRASIGALSKMVGEGSDGLKAIAAGELSLVAPAEAVPVLLDALGHASERLRRDLRKALSHTTKSEQARAAFAKELEPAAFQRRPEVVRIDLLRSMGATLGTTPQAREALASLLSGSAAFRTKFLLLAPAAELAREGDERALSFVRTSLRREGDPHLRTRAAEVGPRIPRLAPELVAATEDPEVRVREAAVQSLGTISLAASDRAAAMSALERRLSIDAWPFVRAASARSLARMPAAERLPESQRVDRALAAALRDPSPAVRADAVEALGTRGAYAQIKAVRERAWDDSEDLTVRASAIFALASLCDTTQVEDLTKMAQRAAAPQSERDQRLGAASIAALGLLHPDDLATRLRPLIEGRKVPPNVRDLARAATRMPAGCMTGKIRH